MKVALAQARESSASSLAERFAATRALTSDLAAPLSDADATIQPFPDASPAKWHLAHTTWFFETFVLRDRVPGYRLFDESWPYLFNSYYEGEGARHPRPKRGMLSRPTLDEIRDYRASIDDALLSALPSFGPADLELVELGIDHEQQHQELFLTDILATFAENPLEPAYGQIRHCDPGLDPGEAIQTGVDWIAASPTAPRNDGWLEGRTGIVEIGAPADGFAFDHERPRHRALLEKHEIASAPITNAQWDEFIADRGYRTANLWLSEGWDWVLREQVERPLYWGPDGTHFTLAGRIERDPAAPVCHVSYFEADAFARWAGMRLPREEEWESAAEADDPTSGQQLDEAGAVVPQPKHGYFGGVWEWTQSAFASYSGFRTAEGTIGEYNGKFMSGQLVLRGASCATPRGHSRVSYRNFFPPHARWQFTGLRLARDS